MASRKVAPNLQGLVGGAHLDEDGRGGPANTPEVIAAARAELRALLRSHRLLEQAWRELPAGHPLLKPIDRALARLSRVSRKGERR